MKAKNYLIAALTSVFIFSIFSCDLVINKICDNKKDSTVVDSAIVMKDSVVAKQDTVKFVSDTIK